MCSPPILYVPELNRVLTGLVNFLMASDNAVTPLIVSW